MNYCICFFNFSFRSQIQLLPSLCTANVAALLAALECPGEERGHVPPVPGLVGSSWCNPCWLMISLGLHPKDIGDGHSLTNQCFDEWDIVFCCHVGPAPRNSDGYWDMTKMWRGLLAKGCHWHGQIVCPSNCCRDSILPPFPKFFSSPFWQLSRWLSHFTCSDLDSQTYIYIYIIIYNSKLVQHNS